MKKHCKMAALILVLALCLSMLAACGQNSGDQPGTENQPPVSQAPETQMPETQMPEETPSQEPEVSEEPEDTRVIKEEFVFEGPGIFTDIVNYPDSYKEDAAQQGTVEVVTYNNGIEEKYFHIYLPYGYDSSDASYNVLYLMHGGNGRPEVYLQPSHATGHQKLFDNMIQNGEVEPFIVVAPTWNSSVSGGNTDGAHDASMSLTEQFAVNELVQYVIPLVDGNYRTNATREGRAFGGFSMGGVTTWYTFLHDLDYIKYFAPFSGDCWVMGETAGSTQSKETVAAMEAAVIAQGYNGDDFVIYAMTGTQDIAIPNMAPQIYAMQDSDMFAFGENTYFGAYPEGLHMETYTRIYLYNILPYLWNEGPKAAMPVENDAAGYLWEIPEDATDEEVMNLVKRNYKIIQAFEPLYTEESYDAYTEVYNKQFKRKQDIASARAAIGAQSLLQQTLTVEDGVWFLWDDSVGPMVDGESHTEEELDAALQDAYGFRPFIIKYLLDDPTTAKGNIVMISGGAMTQRSNPAEGYPAAELFREMGYNCFLLQRRVAPYAEKDIYMDCQRAVRMVRYYAELEGWGGQDMIAACGFSGGAGTILGMIRNCYGDMLPTVYDSDYVADEIDLVNGDLDVAMILYGAYNQDGVGTYVGDNPNLPAFYICHGIEDDTIPYTNAQELYDLVSASVPAELYLIENAKHGFGPGLSSTAAEGCKLWPGQADAFMQENVGHSGN